MGPPLPRQAVMYDRTTRLTYDRRTVSPIIWGYRAREALQTLYNRGHNMLLRAPVLSPPAACGLPGGFESATPGGFIDRNYRAPDGPH
jgi:hypothetical protein